jgi:superfamily II DNA or RNA helicase
MNVKLSKTPPFTNPPNVTCNALMTLHDYQIEHIEQVQTGFKTVRSIMLQMPTGTGKTHVFCEIAKTFCGNEGKRVLILAHRNELISQIQERLIKFGFNAGIIKSGHKTDDSRQVQIASVQTLRKRNKILFLNNISLIIVDEAHHTPSKTYLEILDTYQKEHTKLLGVTATPIRLDGKGFEKIFDKLICSYPFKWFVENNFLCPIKHYASNVIKLENVSLVKNREGYMEYDEKQTEKYYLNETVMSDIIESYKNYGENKKSVVFAITIKHAEEIEKRFIEAGYKATLISSLTNSKERKSKVEKFKKGEIQILVNVDIFSEGFDCPDIELVQIAKPTKSLVKYLQMIGRVTRTYENKQYAMILDNSCLWQDHGLVSNERVWTLNGCDVIENKFDDLFFTDGTNGEEAYKKKIKELEHVDMIEVDNIGIADELVFTKRRLREVCNEYKISINSLLVYLEEIQFPIIEHLYGLNNMKLELKKISVKLYEIIDNKFSSNKGLDNIEL